MSISNYLEVKILDKVFRNADFAVAGVHISLHSADPGETGANEVAGGSYARLSASFDAAAAGATNNNALLRWDDMPAADVTHVGVWDAGAAGNFLWGGPLSAPQTLSAGQSFEIAAGDLDVTLD